MRRDLTVPLLDLYSGDVPGVGDQIWSTTSSGTSAGPGFGGALTIATADSRVGWVVFELPADVVPAKMQVVLDSGFADAAGAWRVSA